MSGFAPLLLEAVRDAVRRRLVAGIVVVCVLSVMMIESCTSCAGGGEVVVNGEVRSLESAAGALGAFTVVVIGLWGVALAGALASDHLRQTLDDGTAALTLSRPVGRGAFALARWAGALGVALGALALLIGAAAFLLATRNALVALPALVAGLAGALGAAVMAALAMAASLVLPRLATVLLVLVGVGVTALANGWGVLRGGAAGGWLGLVDQLGPPFASALAAPLAAWVPQLAPVWSEPVLVLRMLAWLALGLAALLLGFRRVAL